MLNRILVWIRSHWRHAIVCGAVSVILLTAVILLDDAFRVYDPSIGDYAYNTTLFLLSCAVAVGIGVLLFLPLQLLSRTWKRVWALALLALGPILSYVLCEYIYISEVFHHRLYSMMALGLLFHYAICFMIFALTNRAGVAVAVTSIVFYVYAMVNYAVTLFRGSPILPVDLLSIQTGLSVAGHYTLAITQQMIYGTLIEIALLIVAFRCRYRSTSNYRWPMRAASLALSVALVLSYYGFNLFNKTGYSFSYFEQYSSYKTYGAVVSFFENVKSGFGNEPDGYHAKAVASLAAQYLDREQPDAGRRPNIIAVMNETFCDFGAFGNELGLDGPTAPFLDSLTENTAKGEIFVSVRGGNTCNTEYEFLTGNSLFCLSPGSLPYQQYICQPQPSVVNLLKELQYETVAMHPAPGSNWNRDTVYPDLGFDRELFLPDFTYTEEYRNYVSDESCYQEIEQLFQQKDKGTPLFVFNVTIQNHGPFGEGLEGDKNRVVQFVDSNYPLAQNYLNLIRESDAALEHLVRIVDTCDEPTILIFFGDHQPVNLEETFENIALGLDSSSSASAQLQKKYTTQFFLHANFELEQADYGLTSPNYLGPILFEAAGLPMSPYLIYLSDLQQTIPALNAFGFIDQDGTFFQRDTKTKYDTTLNQYRYAVYNSQFDNAGRAVDFFLLEH